MKRNYFQAAVASILLYGCTTWTLTKRLEKKLNGYYTRMLRVILNKSWQQHPTRHQLYGHLPLITKTIQVRRTRHAEHCWRSRDELISDVHLWTPTHGRANAGWPARTYIQQLCEDTGCCPEDLPEAMNDREKWWERVRDIRASSDILLWTPSHGWAKARQSARTYVHHLCANTGYSLEDLPLLTGCDTIWILKRGNESKNSKVETLLYSLERTSAGIGLHVNADKTEYTCFNQRGNISTRMDGPFKQVEKFTHFRSINTPQAKAWPANDSSHREVRPDW